MFARAAGQALSMVARDGHRVHAPCAGGTGAAERVPHASGVQHASLRNGDDALHPPARAEGRRPRHVDDSARLVHDEAERGRRDAAGELAGVQPAASVRARRTGGRAMRRSSAISRSALCGITGLAAVSLQPNSGAQGEFAGLMTIRAYHRDRGDAARDVVLIPASAHGTNPASATMAGLRVVVVACDDQGYIDVDDLRAKAAQHRRSAGGADGDVSVHLRHLRGAHPRDLRRSSTSTAGRSTWTART